MRTSKIRDTPTLFMVIPCYNEEQVLPETAKQIRTKLLQLRKSHKIAQESRVIFVNDGSKDTTWELIVGLYAKYPHEFMGIDLSRNKGHQNALLAGMMTVRDRCDAIVSLDADLQDDINAIDAMVDEYTKGADIVYGVRSKRTTDTWFKRRTAELFYRIMRRMGVDMVFNHADYRLMSRKALEGLAEFGEVNLFLRGIVPMIGYTAAEVRYERYERFAGESKYPLKKMIGFAAEGVTSLSVKPVRLVMVFGVCILAIGAVLCMYSLAQFFLGHTVPGWTSILVSLWIIGGTLMVSLGIVGEYVGKIYMETKQRPRYIVREFLGDVADESR